MVKQGLKLSIAIALVMVSVIAISFSHKSSQNATQKIEAIALASWMEILDSNQWHPLIKNEFILAETDSFTILQIPTRRTFSKTKLNKETGENEQTDSTLMRNIYIISRVNANTGYKFDSLSNKGEPTVINTPEEMTKNTVSNVDSYFRQSKLKFHLLSTERKGNLIRNYFHPIDSTGKTSTDTLICEYEIGQKQNMRFVFSKMFDTIPGATFRKLIFIIKGDYESEGPLKHDRKFIASAEKVPASRVDDLTVLLEKVRQMERKTQPTKSNRQNN